LDPEILKTKVHNALALPFILHRKEILNLRQKDKKRLTSFEMKFFTHTFSLQKEWSNFTCSERRTSWRETSRIHIKLAMPCNKNEQHQGAKYNVELWTKWTKMTWRTFEESIKW